MVEATKESFRDLVAEGVSLVDVWGPDCAPCIALMPDVERIETERGPDFRVVKIEAPKNRRLCIDLRVMGLPHFLLFRDGEELDRLGGDVTASELRTWVDETLSEVSTERS